MQAKDLKPGDIIRGQYGPLIVRKVTLWSTGNRMARIALEPNNENAQVMIARADQEITTPPLHSIEDWLDRQENLP